MNEQAQKQGYIYGLQALKKDSKTLGYIEKGSFDFGGSKAESVDIDAEQVPDAPVWTLLQSNATVKPKFKLIQLQFENLQAVLGGTLKKDASDNIVGWSAPSTLVQINGKIEIDTPSGHRITIYNAMVNANIDGGLTMDAVAKIDCELSVLKPADGGAPYSIDLLDDDGNVIAGTAGAAPASAGVPPFNVQDMENPGENGNETETETESKSGKK